ncbi:MAG: hypothetical protein GY913_27245 [Proteobacteria bacterium]|nr:hypothetical protein [Pseudomonadota bacterium]
MNQRHLAPSLLAAGAITSIATSQPRWSASTELEPIAIDLVGDTALETTVTVSMWSDVRHPERLELAVVASNIELIGGSGEPFELELATGDGPEDRQEESDAEHANLWLAADCDDSRDCEQEFTFSMTPSRALEDGELVAFELDVHADVGGVNDGDEPDPVVELALELGTSTLSTGMGGELLLDASDTRGIILQVESETLDEPVSLDVTLEGDELELLTVRLLQSNEVLAEARGDEVLSIPACASGLDCSEGYVLEIDTGEFAPGEAIEWHAKASISSSDEIPAGHLSVAEIEMGL